MVFGTIALFALTLAAIAVSIWTTRQGRKASDQALAETKRSVDAFISREAGFIVIERFFWSGDIHLHYCGRNHGNSIIHIVGFRYRFQLVRSEEQARTELTDDYTAVNRAIGPGIEFVDNDDADETALRGPLVLPPEIADNPRLWTTHTDASQNLSLIVTLDFLYNTPFGLYNCRVSEIVEHDGAHHPSLLPGLWFTVTRAEHDEMSNKQRNGKN